MKRCNGHRDQSYLRICMKKYFFHFFSTLHSSGDTKEFVASQWHMGVALDTFGSSLDWLRRKLFSISLTVDWRIKLQKTFPFEIRQSVDPQSFNLVLWIPGILMDASWLGWMRDSYKGDGNICSQAKRDEEPWVLVRDLEETANEQPLAGCSVAVHQSFQCFSFLLCVVIAMGQVDTLHRITSGYTQPCQPICFERKGEHFFSVFVCVSWGQ